MNLDPGKYSGCSRGILCMAAAALSFAVMSTCAKVLGETMATGQVSFFRAFLTALLVLPFALSQRAPLFGVRRIPLFLRGLCGSLSLILGFYAITHMPLADAILLWQTSVFFVPFLTVLVLRERVERSIIVYSIVAFVGCALILKPEATVFNLGGVAALGAGFCVALVSLTVRALHATESSLTIIWCFGFYTSLICAMLFGAQFRLPGGDEWHLVAGIGIFGTLGQILFTEAFRFAPAAIVQPYLFLQVVASGILGFFVFDELPNGWSILGAAIIIGCGLRIYRLSATRADTPSPPEGIT